MGVKGQGHRSLGHLYNFSCLGYAVSMATSTKMEHTLLVWIQIEKIRYVFRFNSRGHSILHTQYRTGELTI